MSSMSKIMLSPISTCRMLRRLTAEYQQVRISYYIFDKAAIRWWRDVNSASLGNLKNNVEEASQRQLRDNKSMAFLNGIQTMISLLDWKLEGEKHAQIQDETICSYLSSKRAGNRNQLLDVGISTARFSISSNYLLAIIKNTEMKGIHKAHEVISKRITKMIEFRMNLVCVLGDEKFEASRSKLELTFGE
ncbi:12258_t:CDS:2 [Ambispora leptoticha]|uniref:12258_t:CDS:1 n=1 Tax=Ambispora leptoticha TaxID=144679 RepID=A0A9N8VH36_9GLOM|nr:12258_t:CDS:2 [Ambispora leptoticha]